MTSILVTWWTGFIWSHTAVLLVQAWYDIVIFDNLSNSSKDVVHRIRSLTNKDIPFVEGDLRDADALDIVFTTYAIDAVIHFAWLKSVGVSCSEPFAYYENNVVWTLHLLRCMDMYDVRRMIFSSSATVYDASCEQAPFVESMRTGHTTNPYGTTKHIIEHILEDMVLRKHMHITALRYFNPIGWHPSGMLWEDPSDIPTNLLPVIMETVTWTRQSLEVFWDDYDTPDGTCLRDYIHVMDLAEAHVVALQALIENPSKKYTVYNVGTWKGTSVVEMINLVNTVVAPRSVAYDIAPRRDGDVAVSVADVSFIEKELWRKAQLTVQDGIQDAWRFRKSLII